MLTVRLTYFGAAAQRGLWLTQSYCF